MLSGRWPKAAIPLDPAAVDARARSMQEEELRARNAARAAAGQLADTPDDLADEDGVDKKTGYDVWQDADLWSQLAEK